MLQEFWAVCASLLVAVVPGGAVLLAARLRGWLLVASPLVTYGIVTVGAAASTWVNLPWTIWGFLLCTVVMVAIAISLSSFIPQFLPAGWPTGKPDVVGASIRRWQHVAVAACAAVGGLFGAVVLRRGMGSLNAINQDWDAVFHAAAVRWIVEAQDLSQASLAQLNNRDSVETFFYPNSWHGLAALNWELGVDSIPRILNAGSLLMPIFLAFGIAALLLHLTRSPLIAGASAILVTMPSALVYDLLWRGPLIPYAVGLAMAPALVLLFIRALSARAPGLLFVTGLAAGGVVGVHPSGVYTAIIFLAPWIIQRWITRWRLISGDLLAILCIGAVAALVALSGLLTAMSVGSDATQNWPAVENAGQAFGEALLLNHARATPQWAIVILAFIGFSQLRKFRELWWFWVSGGIALGLFVAAAAYDYPLMEQLTAPWWNDRWRFAAMVAMFVAVAAGIGFAAIVTRASRELAARTTLSTTAAGVVGGAVVVALFTAVSHGWYAADNSQRLHDNFQSGAVINEDDLDLWSLASDIVPEGQMVLNDPTDGSTWMFAMEGLRPYFGGMTLAIPGQAGPTTTQELLLFDLDEIGTNPAVRDVVEESGIEYVIVGDGFIHGMGTSPGFNNLDDNPSFELVEQVGGSKLFRIVD